jgi:hypothetical protein
MLRLVEVQLLNQILVYAEALAAGGGTTTQRVLCGVVNPTVDPGTTCAIYYRTDTGSVWIWDGALWQNIILQ